MATNGIVPKIPLQTISMFRSHVSSCYPQLEIDGAWRIPNFGKLKDNITFTSIHKLNDWTFSVTKKRKSLIVTMQVKRTFGKVECAIVGLKNKEKAEEISKGLYSVKFQDYGKDKFTEDITMHLTFKFFEFEDNFSCRSHYKPTHHDNDGTFESLLRMYLFVLESKPPHRFSLLTECGTRIHMYKPLLALRSVFFRQYFQIHPQAAEFRVRARHTVIVEIMNYIFLGGIILDGSWEKTKEIFRWTVKLGVKGLKPMLESHIKQIINKVNVREILELGMQTEAEELVAAAEEFLENDKGILKK